MNIYNNVAIISIFALLLGVNNLNAQGTVEFDNDVIMVKFKMGVTQTQIDQVLSDNGLSIKSKFKSNVFSVSIDNVLDKRIATGAEKIAVEQKVTSLLSNDIVKYAEPSTYFYKMVKPNDPGVSCQYAIENKGTSGGTNDSDMDLTEAWVYTKGKQFVKIGVIDSGIDPSHPDLKDNLWVNSNEIPGNYYDDDDNGYIDDIHGINSFSVDSSYNIIDRDGHGTFMSGIIGARGNNYEGISGVNWYCNIVTIKAENPKTHDLGYEAIYRGIEYLEDCGVKLVNCSWAAPLYKQILKEKMEESEMLFICAAGNYPDIETIDNDSLPVYPASFELDNIISVSNTNNKDELDWTSRFGAYSIDIAAPGTDIVSTVPMNIKKWFGYYLDLPGCNLDTAYYATGTGTSNSTAQVTGIAALLLSVAPTLSAQELREIIIDPNNTDLKASLVNKVITGGRVNPKLCIESLKRELVIRNDFGGGEFKVNDTTRYGIYYLNEFVGNTVTVNSWNQTYLGDGYVFDYWEGTVQGRRNSNTTTFTIVNDEVWTAHYKISKSVTFKNETEAGKNLSNSKLKINSTEISSGTTYSLLPGAYTISTKKDTLNDGVTKLKHNNWNEKKNDFKISHTLTLSNSSSIKDDKARFKILSPATVSVGMDGQAVSAQIQIKDPWYVETNGSQPGNWKTYPSGFTPSTMPNGGIFLNEEIIPGNPTYSAKVTETYIPNLNGSNAWFQYWSGPTGSIDNPAASETPIVFKNANDVILANYKGHLRTGVPDLSDAKNQRRYLINGLVSNKQVMVYESMGHVWISHSTDGGATWSAEKRLSGINGGGNPTLSNMIDWDGSNAYFAVSWVENTSVMIQSMVISGTQLYFGWTNYSTTQNAENLINVSQSKTLEYSLTTGRPALAIQTWFDGGIPKEIDVRFAHETAYGLVFAELRTSGYRRLDLANVITQPPIGGIVAHVSTSSADCQPVLISYPAANGQPAKSVLYYLGTGYAAGYRIVEFDTQTQVKRILSTASNDYTYHSLAGAVNSTSASFALVATAQVNTPSVAYNTNIYTKPTYYGNSLPTVAKVYANTVKPAIMVQNTSGFGSPTYQVHMTTNGTSTRVKADGGSTLTTVATNTAGSWLSAQVGSGNRKAMVVRSNSTPATIQYYNGTTQLSKGGDYVVDVRAFRYFTLKNGKSGAAVLDFSGSQVEAIDSLETGENLAVVLVKNPASSGVLVYQPDSLVVPLSVDVLRDGKEIAAYAATSWKSLGAASFADLRDRDVLRFRLADPVTATWGYEEYTVADESMAKEDTPEETVEELESLTEGIKIYPNPFNPITTIQVSLAEPKMVRLAVYNILGQMVSELVNGELGAGRHSYSFNGSNLSSGTYFYRLEAGGEVTTGKLQLLK